MLSACSRPPTEIVAVDSGLPWGPGAALQSVSVEVRQGDASGRVHSLRTTALGVGTGRRALPLPVGLLPPEEQSDAAVWIEVRGCATPEGCALGEAVVVQRAVVRFRGRADGGAADAARVVLRGGDVCGGSALRADDRDACGCDGCAGDGAGVRRAGHLGGADATVRADVMDGGASDDRPDAMGRMDVEDAGGPTGERPDVGDTRDRPDVDVLDAGRDVVDSGMSVDMPVATSDSGGVVCPSGQTNCGGSCRDLRVDGDHCGRCDRTCRAPNGSAVCTDGVCRVDACDIGFFRL
ncbi:MAG: hypothetical protein IPN17_23855 [Deltaproteobacteria bacterium]|nr:hypothetical protein [Deltaproteobacteria bacterium]